MCHGSDNIASGVGRGYLSTMNEDNNNPFDEGKKHPKVGCGAVNCCQSCDGPHEETGKANPYLVVMGALLFLIVVTTVARHLFMR